MKSSLFTFLLSLAISSVFAQSFMGHVLDNQTGEPIPFSAIHLPDIDNGVVSDAHGFFTVTDYPRKNLKIQILSMGYESYLEEINLGEITRMEFRLIPSHFELKELVVSFPIQKLANENVVDVSRKKLNDLNGGATISMAQVLTDIPGVDQVSTGSGIGKPVIRGLSGSRIVTYSQGVRLENQQFGDEHGLGENAVGVSRAEVIKGPASLLYGADALGGVVYLVSEPFSSVNITEGFVGSNFMSHQNSIGGRFGLKTNKSGIKWNLFGAYNSNADYSIPNGERVENTRYDELSIKSSIGYSKKNWVGNFRYAYLKNKFGIPEGELGDSKSRDRLLPNQVVSQHIVSSENVIFLGKTELSATVGFGSNQREEFEESQDEANLSLLLNSLTFNLKSIIPSSDNAKFILGVQGMNRKNINKADEILIPDATTNDVGLYSVGSFDLSERLAIQAGARADYRTLRTIGFSDADKTISALDRDFTSLNFSLGSIFTIGQVTIQSNLASGFRPPNTAELLANGVHEGTLRYEIGDSDLKSERAIQADLRVEFENEHLTIAINPFYNRIAHYIYLKPTTETQEGNSVFRYDQIGARLYGGEGGIHFHPHGLHWLHVESNYSLVLAQDNSGSYLPLIPAAKLQSKFSAEVFLEKKVNANIFLEHVHRLEQRRVSDLETNTPSYHLFNIGGLLEAGNFEWEIGVNNIFNVWYIDHLSRLKSSNVPNPGRSVFLGLNYSF